jgi:hypothetical protein
MARQRLLAGRGAWGAPKIAGRRRLVAAVAHDGAFGRRSTLCRGCGCDRRRPPGEALREELNGSSRLDLQLSAAS